MRIANYGLALLGLASSHGLAAAQNDPDDAAAGAVLPGRGARRGHRVVGAGGDRGGDNKGGHAELQEERESGRNHFFIFVSFLS